MKHMLSLLLCAALLICSLSLYVYAEEETTAQTESAQKATHIVFNGELTGKKNIVHSTNDLAKGAGSVSKNNEWQGIKIEIKNAEDPHIGLDYSKFLDRFGFDKQNAEDHPFIVLKVLADEIAFDDFEIYYCAGDVATPTEDCRTGSDYAHDAGNGELYFVYDLTGDAEGEMHMFRVDILGAEEGALMYLTDMVFFATEEEALEWCGYYDAPATESTEEPTTEEPTTEDASTEAETQNPDSTRPVRNEEEKGCKSVIGMGAIVAIISLGVVCFKKKD